MFAKLFEDTPVGQVLVKKGQDPHDDSPEIRFYWEHANVCVETALCFEDDDDGHKDCDHAFAQINREAVIAIVEGNPLWKSLAEHGDSWET